MAIELKATCDADGCTNEIDLHDATGDLNWMKESILFHLKEGGWAKDTDSNYCYCKKCFPKVKEELGL